MKIAIIGSGALGCLCHAGLRIAADKQREGRRVDEDTVVMEIPKDDLHAYLAINPKNAEEMLDGMLSEELANATQKAE